MFDRSWTVLAGILLVLAGCSGDPKAASDANFAAALQRWYDAHGECVPLVAQGSVPIVRKAADRMESVRIDAGVAAGLLTVESFREIPPFGREPVDYRRYRPTETGESAIVEDDRGIGGVRLCFAHRKVERVLRHTEPGDAGGLQISRVTYRYAFKDVPSWTGHAEIRSAFPAIGDRLAEMPAEASDTLVLTGDGWEHQRALR